MKIPAHLIAASKLVITTENKTLRNPTQGFKAVKRKENTSQRWVLELTTGGLDYKKARELFTFLCMAEGTYKTLEVPNISPKMSELTHALVLDAISKNQISADYEGELCVGEFIQFDTHPKVHVVTSVETGIVEFYPDLPNAVQVGTLINIGSSVNFHCELASDSSDLAFAINDDELSVFSIDFNEEIV